MDIIHAFKILDLTENASLEDVKRAWRELIFIWHPDKHMANKNACKRALDKTKAINEAYLLLCNYLSSKQDTQKEYTFIKCGNCGVTNRIHGHHQYGAKCGKCGVEISQSDARQSKEKDWSQRQMCGDGACIGIISTNGRCTVCGNTWEEGKAAETLRKKSYAHKDKKTTYNHTETFLAKFIASITEKILTAAYKKGRSLRKGYARLTPKVKFYFWGFMIFVVLCVIAALDDSGSHRSTSPKTIAKNIEISNPYIYVRPLLAPNGQQWPSISGYIKKYPIEFTDGLSTVIVDNTRNNSDIFLKLYCRDIQPAKPVRYFLIKAGGKFTVKHIRPGNYEIRYKNLDSGICSKSQDFDLKETETYEGVRYSNMEMTLYKVPHGNMQTYTISEAEF